MKIIISRQELQAALLFASTDETRYIITGVHIAVSPKTDKPTVVATDGRRLCVIETVAEQRQNFEDLFEFTIRPDYAQLFWKLSKACGLKLFPWIQLDVSPRQKRFEVSIVGGPDTALTVADGVLIEGTYPDWKKVLPPKKARRDAITDVALNPELMGDFAKAAKILEASSNTIQLNLVGREGCVEVRLPALPNFYGILMQCKLDEALEKGEYQPEFLQIVKDLPRPEPEESEEKEGAE